MTFLTGQIFLLLIKGGQTCKRTVYVCEWPTLQTTTTTSSAVNSAWTVNRNWTWIKHEKKEKFLFLHSTPFFSFPRIQHTHCFVVMQCPWQTCRHMVCDVTVPIYDVIRLFLLTLRWIFVCHGPISLSSRSSSKLSFTIQENALGNFLLTGYN